VTRVSEAVPFSSGTNDEVVAEARGWRRLLLLAACGATLALLAAIWSSSADAEVPIYGFDTTSTSTQAGGHPDVAVRVEIGTLATDGVEPCFCNAIKNITVNTPSGLVGVPGNITQCTGTELNNNNCPTDSQIGVVAVRLFAPVDAGGVYFVQPLYNMEARPGQLALFATVAPLVQTPIYTVISARTESDYGLEFKTFGVPRLIPPNEITQFTWGVPASDIHDQMRWTTNSPSKSASCFGGGNPLPALFENKFPADKCNFGGPNGPNPAVAPATPFLLNPTSCVGPLMSTLDTEGYEFGTDHAEAPYPATTGCDQLSFDPSLSAKPTTTAADSPSGLDVDLVVPQLLSPDAASPSEIRATRVTLPPGLTIDPNVAEGKVSCSDAEAKFGTRLEAECQEFSKVGTLKVVSSALPAPLPGAIYLGTPLPGNRYRLFLIADGFSLHIKLAGTVIPDPQTGRLTVRFDDLPQTPFQEFDMHFFGAERGLLGTPTHCGSYQVDTEFVPWDAELPNQTSTQFFTIDSGPSGKPCPPPSRPFNPSVSAGVTDNTGGGHTTFSFHLSRDDGDQNLSGATIETPPGFAGKLARIPYCPDAALADAAGALATGLAEQAASACPARSQVGISSAAAGAGSRPISLPGKVYLAGPYKGAPISMAIVTPAVAGPYDLGNVVVRVALRVDPADAHVTAVADPLPQIVEGIPLRLRDVLVLLNRDGFVLNPTNCSPFAVSTQVFGDQGAARALEEHFQVANCGALPYKPRLSLRLSGGLNRRGHPALHAVFTAKPGESNTRTISVALPEDEQLDNGHIGNICTRVKFASDSCPANSVLGSAKATTPLLDKPLEGKVYLRSSSHELPDVVMDLEGQFDIELAGRIDTTKDGALRTTFTNLPDAPISSFRLDLAGGSSGLLINSSRLCGKTSKASTRLVGQNGAVNRTKTKLQVKCNGKARPKRSGKRKGA